MSAALLVPLADAVTSLLNANTFSQKFTATRVYDAMRPLETLSALTVDVVIGDKESDPLDRTRQRETPNIDIVVRQVIAAPSGSADEANAIDALIALVESFDSCITDPANRRPAGAAWAAWQHSKLVMAYSPRKLREQRLFYSVLRVTYLVVTDST